MPRFLAFFPALVVVALAGGVLPSCPADGFAADGNGNGDGDDEDADAGDGEGEGEASGEGEGEPPLPQACPSPLAPRDTAGAVVVGDGTAASCTAAALATAWANVAAGGALVFACGAAPVTIVTDGALVVDRDVTIDGGGLVTLSGATDHRLLRVDSTFDRDTPRLTVQRLGFVDGRSAGDGGDPAQGGGAIFRLGGTLEVIDCSFVDNVAPTTGQDVAGGAISSIGGGTTTVVGSNFVGNRASNGGAIGNLGNALTVVNAAFVDNAATGSGGNPGNGGNGGTISVDGENRTVELCGVAIEGSRAQAFGGAFFRVAYHGEPTTMHRVVVVDAAIDDREPSMAGGLYVQNSTFTLTDSTIAASRARAAGGAYVGPGSTLRFVNVTFDGNTASSSLAGALFLDGVAGGSVTSCTFVGNAAPGPVAFGGAVTGDASRVTLTNTLFVDNVAGNGFNPITCTTRFARGAGSFQFPVVRAGNGGGDGGSDDPGALCAPEVTVADVDLGAVDGTGPVPVRRPLPTSAAVGAGRDCVDTDATGRARGEPCASGAAEP
jgi:hypothetical protein